MRKKLEDSYLKLLEECGSKDILALQNINQIIKESLRDFVKNCSIPAIWCYGKHTKMLMADFIYEMKGIQYVIDANYSTQEETGFHIIREDGIRANNIDGIIISSYKYRNEIKKNILEHYSGIKYLDIYEKLEEKGIILNFEYFSQMHPYSHYCNMNALKQKITKTCVNSEKEKLYLSLIEEYIMIKDFRLAISCAEEAIRDINTDKFHTLLLMLKDIYSFEKEAVAKISENNVCMLCIDGLRRKDILNNLMPQMKAWIEKETFFYKNAYSVSTSTYESLIPAYSENDDLRTRYYERNLINEENCRFVKEAIKQGRKVYFYTDSIPFVDSPYINVIDKMQTATEKMWDFILDAVDEEKGLYYIHVLYESHFSYPNPYTADALIAEGTSIMFDYLTVNGGKLRTDYDKQHEDALKYLDDSLMPFLEKLNCRMVIYADHGNVILPEETDIFDVNRTMFSFHGDLIQVPLIIKSPEVGVGETQDMESLMSLNTIIIGLMKKECVLLEKKESVKIVRSEIYNPDFKYLYQKCGYEQELLAFEVFVFQDGSKLVIYSNGITELFDTAGDMLIGDSEKKEMLISRVYEKITVCD